MSTGARPSSTSRCCCRAAAPWAPTRPASTRRCRGRAASPTGSPASRSARSTAPSSPATRRSSGVERLRDVLGDDHHRPALRHAGAPAAVRCEGDLARGCVQPDPSLGVLLRRRAAVLRPAPAAAVPAAAPAVAGGDQLLRYRAAAGDARAAGRLRPASTPARCGSASVRSTCAPATSSISTIDDPHASGPST